MDKLVPSVDFAVVTKLLEEMDEGLNVLRLTRECSNGWYYGYSSACKTSTNWWYAKPSGINGNSKYHRASRILRQFMEDVDASEDVQIPHFLEKKEALPILTALEHEINDCIDENGTVLDSASSTLRSIRQQLRQQEVECVKN